MGKINTQTLEKKLASFYCSLQLIFEHLIYLLLFYNTTGRHAKLQDWD